MGEGEGEGEERAKPTIFPNTQKSKKIFGLNAPNQTFSV
jgi:hypothetical protein